MLRKLLLTGMFIISASLSAFAQTGTIQGTVTDAASGETLPGANVYIKSLQRGDNADADGNYKISDIPEGTYTLTASFVGYQPYKKQITVSSGSQTVDIKLQVGASLEETVVTGFGQTQQRRDITGSISSIQAEDIQKGNTSTIDQSLQGKTAGVQVTATSGVLGAPISVRVRGTTSINASSQPLYVLDGVPLVNNQLGNNLGEPGSQAINPLINLNPEDIESMEVLKDASATAVYGSRGANGVVLITTKSGSEGRTRINVNVSGGFTQPTEKFDILSAAEYAEMYNYKTSHLPGGAIDPDGGKNFKDDFAPDKLTDQRWPEVVTRNGSIQNYNASVSGGNEQTTYFFSGSYKDQEGFARPNKLKNYSALLKAEHQFNDQLNVGLSLDPSRSVNNRISTSNQVSAPYTLAVLEAPVVPKFTKEGDINIGTSKDYLNNFAAFPGTPYGNRVGIFRESVTTQVNANAHVAYDFIPQLTLKTQFNVQSLQTLEQFKRARYTTDGFPDGTGSANNDEFINYSWRNTLHYINDWNKNSLDVLLGVTFQKIKDTYIGLSGDTYLSTKLLNLASAANITGGTGTVTSYALQNNLGRITYKYNDRYILTLTGSYNGSSRFGSNNRYGFFPAIAGGWIISDEDFAQADWISFLKLRASYGETGNSNGIGNFESRGLLGGGRDYAGQPGLHVSQLASPDLSWESTRQLDIGLDYGFVNNRINGSIGYYNKRTSDLLLGVPVSATNGFRNFTQNIGKIENSGLEFEINADIVTNKDFRWSVNGNISTLKNEVKSVPDAFTSGQNRVQEGSALGSFYLREYAGVDPENGDALYYDDNGGKTNDYNAAPRKINGDPFPNLFGGFGTNFNYKGIDVGVTFNYQTGNKTYWQNGEFMATNLAGPYNQQKSQLDYWTPDNTDASVPEPRSVGNGNRPSTRYLLDSSYLRLKNATVGYTLPQDFVNGYKLRVYAQGTNLLTFTGYKGLDPEVTGSSEANVTQGNTFFELPQPRTIIFGIQLGL